MVFQNRWSLMMGNLVWGTYAFVPSKAGLAKGVLSQRVPLYVRICGSLYLPGQKNLFQMYFNQFPLSEQ